MDCSDPAQGDAFWRLFAPGNTVPLPDRPFERLSDYEEMLWRLRTADQAKYEQMHKGTAFYLMSWLAFDLRNYEKALFYIDSAISEDVRKTASSADTSAWKTAPGAKFLLLEPSDHVARRAVERIRTSLESQVTRFNGVSLRPALDLEFIRRFVAMFVECPSQRAVIAALYILVLEFSDRVQELEVRQGSPGGSSQPFTVHLFTGGLLFESLLKYFYPLNDAGHPNIQIRTIFRNTTAFSRDFNLAQPPDTSANALREIHSAICGSNTIDIAFSTTAKTAEYNRPQLDLGRCLFRCANLQGPLRASYERNSLRSRWKGSLGVFPLT